MTEVLYFGGILNYTDPLLGWQLYIWMWVGIVIITIVLCLVWYYGRWKPFKALHGLYYAFKAESFAAFIFDINLMGELISEAAAKCIFDYAKDWDFEGVETLPWPLGKIQRFLFYYPSAFLDIPPLQAILYKLGKRNMDVDIARKQQGNQWVDASSITVQGIRTDIIVDCDNWSVRNSPQHKAIVESARNWNVNHQDDEIHSYMKYQEYLLDPTKGLPCPVNVNATVTIPWARIDAVFPVDEEDNEKAGARRQMARELEEDEATALSRYYIPILGGSFALAAVILIVRLITFSMAKH